MFFEMTKYDAIKALEVYKRAGRQAENLSDFYDFCKHLELARNFQFPTLRQPPPSFLATMEEYIREAPCDTCTSSKNLDYQEKNLLTFKEEEENADATESSERAAEDVKEEREESLQAEETPQHNNDVEAQMETTGDLLGLEEINPIATEIEHNNALALAIIQPGDESTPITSTDLLSGGSGWELALVTTPSNNISNAVESKLAGGFDKLLLDSLYEDASRRQQIAGGTYMGSQNANSLNLKDPFTLSNCIAPPTNVQMALMAQQQQQQQLYYHQQQQQIYYQQPQMHNYYQQHQHHQQQQIMMVPYTYRPQHSHLQVGLNNPFRNPFYG